MKRFAIRFNAPVVLSFAILSLLVLVLDSATGGASTARLFCVYRAPLTDPLTYVRFFTHVLGHSGYSHYMSNMLLLLLVGPGLEEKYGSRNLLLTIVITAFATGLVQFLLFPHSALLGASGVVFMMIVLSSFTEMKKGGIPLTMLLVVALYLGSEIADGLTRTDNVSHLTHIVGGVCGIVFGFRLPGRRKDSPPPTKQPRSPPEPADCRACALPYCRACSAARAAACSASFLLLPVPVPAVWPLSSTAQVNSLA